MFHIFGSRTNGDWFNGRANLNSSRSRLAGARPKQQRADAQKRKLDLLPGRHDELEKTVAEAFAASPAEIEIARKYYKQ